MLGEILDFDKIGTFEKEFPGYGLVRIKMPTLKQQAKITGKTSEILSGQGGHVAETDYVIAEAFATMDEIIILKPAKLDLDNLYDFEILLQLWRWYCECLEKFEEEQKKRKESSIR